MRKQYHILGSNFNHIVDKTEERGLKGDTFYFKTKSELDKSLTTYGKKCLKLGSYKNS
jgi:hypothetical protein